MKQEDEPAYGVSTILPRLIERRRPALGSSRVVERIGRIENPDAAKLVAIGESRAIVFGNGRSVATYGLFYKQTETGTGKNSPTSYYGARRVVSSGGRICYRRGTATRSASAGRSVVVGLDNLEIDRNHDRYHDHSQRSEPDESVEQRFTLRLLFLR
jgi:hypothetical protein